MEKSLAIVGGEVEVCIQTFGGRALVPARKLFAALGLLGQGLLPRSAFLEMLLEFHQFGLLFALGTLVQEVGHTISYEQVFV